MDSKSDLPKEGEAVAIAVDDSELEIPEDFDKELARRAAADNRKIQKPPEKITKKPSREA